MMDYAKICEQALKEYDELDARLDVADDESKLAIRRERDHVGGRAVAAFAILAYEKQEAK